MIWAFHFYSQICWCNQRSSSSLAKGCCVLWSPCAKRRIPLGVTWEAASSVSEAQELGVGKKPTLTKTHTSPEIPQGCQSLRTSGQESKEPVWSQEERTLLFSEKNKPNSYLNRRKRSTWVGPLCLSFSVHSTATVSGDGLMDMLSQAEHEQI